MRKKYFEIRDRLTFIPAVAFTVSRGQSWLAGRAGYGDLSQVVLVRLSDLQTNYDPFAWGGRTMPTAHKYIQDHWESLESGDLIDVEFIRGESPNPKESEKEYELISYD